MNDGLWSQKPVEWTESLNKLEQLSLLNLVRRDWGSLQTLLCRYCFLLEKKSSQGIMDNADLERLLTTVPLAFGKGESLRLGFPPTCRGDHPETGGGLPLAGP